MAMKYADRAVITVNGARLADVKSGSLKQDLSVKPVATMTDDGYNRGFVRGNKTIDISLQLAVQNKLSRPKLEFIDYENNDVQISWYCGAEVFTAIGVVLKTAGDDASGVGEEANASFEFMALKLIDQAGNSALFPIQFN